MAEEQKPIFIKKIKVISVKDNSFTPKDSTEEIKGWEIVIQDDEDHSKVMTTYVYKVLDDKIKEGALLENVRLYKKGEKLRLYLQGEGQQGGKRTYGKSEAELKIMRQELMSRRQGVYAKYAQEILLQTHAGDFPWDEWYKKTQETLLKFNEDMKIILGG